MVIAVLAISIPLPATAAAFGAPPCLQSPAGAAMQAGSVATAAKPGAVEAREACGCHKCRDCVSCEAPCAIGAAAAFNSQPPMFTPRARWIPRVVLAATALPSHPETPFRPPALLQS